MFYDHGMCPVRVLCAYLQSSGCSRTKGRPVRERIVVIIVGRWRLMCMRVYGVCVCVCAIVRRWRLFRRRVRREREIRRA